MQKDTTGGYDGKVVYVDFHGHGLPTTERRPSSGLTYPFRGCPQVLHLQQKSFCAFCGGERGVGEPSTSG
ncbi:MAG: hypothetical protein ACLRWQ_23045 [Flavonifractor plautii]